MKKPFYRNLFLLDVAGNFEDLKKVRLVNYCCLITILISSIFIFINLFSNKPILVLINFSTLLIGLIGYYFNRKNKTEISLYLIGIFFSALASYSAIYYRNGLEVYLILNLGVLILILKKPLALFFLSVYHIGLYLLTFHFINTSTSEHALPLYRRELNYAICLIVIIAILQYFKQIHINYSVEIDTQNNKIIEQQKLLIISKNDLQQKNEALEKISLTREKLLSIIAHDIKSPMVGLKSSLDLLNDEIISIDEFKTHSLELSIRIDQLNNNLDNLLQWAQSQMMGIVANPVNFSVKETILDTVNFLKQFLEAKKLSIDIDVPDNLYAYADENHIKLICRNIITNAIKFSYPESCIYIKANIENNVVQIAIKDEGVGMKSETVLHLFNPLKISSNYGTLNEKGTGLGLQLCKEFLEKNNGKIEVTSELSKGSTFTFAIPTA